MDYLLVNDANYIPVDRKALVREAARLVDNGVSVREASFAVYERFHGEPWRTLNDGNVLERNLNTISRSIRNHRKLATA